METQRKVTELQVTVGGAGDTAGTRTWSLCWKHGHRHSERRAHCCSWHPGSAAAWVHSYITYKKKVCKAKTVYALIPGLGRLSQADF